MPQKYAQDITQGDHVRLGDNSHTVTLVEVMEGYTDSYRFTLDNGRKLTFWAGDSMEVTS
jgi:hypothetical protein